MYSEKVMDHFANPRNSGIIENASGEGTGGAAIATSSMITEIAKGMTVDEALEITRNDVADALDGLPPIKMHCSNLAADALTEAIKDYKSKKSE